MRSAFRILYFAGVAAAAAPAGCSLNPAAGEQSFTAFMSQAEEQRVGAREHPRIVQQFGGVYQDGDITDYVSAIGRDLVHTSDRPDLQFTFTVLDSEIVNAFALPGGYIYVTRGLAELAGVIAHEIGHVTARHAAQRYTSRLSRVSARRCSAPSAARPCQPSRSSARACISAPIPAIRSTNLTCSACGICPAPDTTRAPCQVSCAVSRLIAHYRRVCGAMAAADSICWRPTRARPIA